MSCLAAARNNLVFVHIIPSNLLFLSQLWLFLIIFCPCVTVSQILYLSCRSCNCRADLGFWTFDLDPLSWLIDA
eukprot:3378959-Rhodomonas_salina.1